MQLVSTTGIGDIGKGIGTVGKNLFPQWAAPLTLVKDNGVSAARHATDAWKATDLLTRLDAAVRTLTSLDHSIDNIGKLPLEVIVPRAAVYFRGYDAAKQAVTMLVTSGAIPAAAERVGRQLLLAAKETFVAGAGATMGERSRYTTHLANGWLEATAEDAVNGVRALGNSSVGRELLTRLEEARAQAARGNRVDTALAAKISTLFDSAAKLTSDDLNGPVAVGTPSAELLARTGALLQQAEQSAQALVADARRSEGALEHLRTAV